MGAAEGGDAQLPPACHVLRTIGTHGHVASELLPQQSFFRASKKGRCFYIQDLECLCVGGGNHAHVLENRKEEVEASTGTGVTQSDNQVPAQGGKGQ